MHGTGVKIILGSLVTPNSISNSALDGDEWSALFSCCFTPEEGPPPLQYPLKRRLLGPPELFGHFGENNIIIRSE